MKRLYNFMPAVLLIVMLSACGKQAGTDSSADKVSEPYLQAESAETTEQAEQDGDNTVTGDISFDFETKTVLLNSGYEMPIYGIGTYSLTGDTCGSSSHRH